MRRTALIVAVALLVIVGLAYMAYRDADGAIGEIGALQSQVLDIQKDASGSPSPARLNQMAIRLTDIRSELSDMPSRHRLAFAFFGSLQTDINEVSNLDARVATSINLRR